MIGGRIFDNKRTGYRVLDAVRVLRGSSAVVLQPRQIVKTTVLVERDFGNLLRGENVSPRTRHIRLSKGRTYSMDLFDWDFGNYKSSGLFVPKLMVEKGEVFQVLMLSHQHLTFVGVLVTANGPLPSTEL